LTAGEASGEGERVAAARHRPALAAGEDAPRPRRSLLELQPVRPVLLNDVGVPYGGGEVGLEPQAGLPAPAAEQLAQLGAHARPACAGLGPEPLAIAGEGCARRPPCPRPYRAGKAERIPRWLSTSRSTAQRASRSRPKGKTGQRALAAKRDGLWPAPRSPLKK
jgi:hypothetical protein